MNRQSLNSSASLIGVFSLLAFLSGCSKENLNDTNDGPSQVGLEMKYYAEFANTPTDERMELLNTARNFLLDPGLYKTAGEDELTASEAFLALEGITNNVYYSEAADTLPIIDTYEESWTITMDVYNDGSTDRVADSSFAAAYATIVNLIDAEVNEEREYPSIFFLADLGNVGISSGVMTLQLNVVFAIIEPIPGATLPLPSQIVFPAGDIYAADKAGWCPNTPAPIDAADYLRAYINSTAPHKSTPCNGSWYLIVVGGVTSYDYDGDNTMLVYPSHSQWYQWCSPRFWQNTSNQCVGGSVWWHQHYGFMRNLRDDFGVNFETYVNNINPPLSGTQFLVSDWHSHDPSSSISNYTSPVTNGNYWHGGFFYYGFANCQ